VLERFDDGLGDQLLGEVEVAEDADQARGEAARLLPKDSLERVFR
jgi:hypothetical protein